MRGLLIALALLGCVPALAAPNPYADLAGARAPMAGLQHVAARELSVEQAARVAQRAVGGRVLAAEPALMDGRKVVRVKLLTRDGVVRVVVVDAATGQVR